MEVIKRGYVKVYEDGKLISKTPVGTTPVPAEKPVYELTESGDESA